MAHDREELEHLLPTAERFVVQGEELVTQQEARVAALRDAMGEGDFLAQRIFANSKRLLATMRQTQQLQVDHVRMLRQELSACLPEPGAGFIGSPLD